MLKDFLEKFDKVGITTFEKGEDGNNILVQQSICNNFKRIFNGKFIEMSYSGDHFQNNNIIIKNSPSKITSKKINNHEENIELTYGIKVINLTGYKKR